MSGKIWLVERRLENQKTWFVVREPRDTRKSARSLQWYEEQTPPNSTHRVRKYVRVEPKR